MLSRRLGALRRVTLPAFSPFAWLRAALVPLVVLIAGASLALPVSAAGATASSGPVASAPRSEAELILPDLSKVEFFGLTGNRLLAVGLVVCVFGLLFGL